MTPEWEKLASVIKGTAKIAYWDTEQRSRPPPLLGEIKGTPTIRLFKPKAKQGGGTGVSKKVVVDYQYERKASHLKKFLDEQMPNFLERINGKSSFEAFQEKAKRNGLPQALLFTSKPNTSSLSKYLSVEFRRRILIAEIPPTKNNKNIMEAYGIVADKLPALLVIPPNTSSEEAVRYEKTDFTRRRLYSFLSGHALKDKVFKKKNDEQKEQKKKHVHSEF